MKRLFLLLALLPFLCTCDRGEEALPAFTPSSISWELKESLISPGPLGDWRPVESDLYLRFENGKVHTNGFAGLSPEEGQTEVIFDYSPDEQIIYVPREDSSGDFLEYPYQLEADLSTLTVPSSLFCLEPCLSRYHRPEGE